MLAAAARRTASDPSAESATKSSSSSFVRDEALAEVDAGGRLPGAVEPSSGVDRREEGGAPAASPS